MSQSQSGCSTIKVPGQSLQEMTRIGQGGLDDWSSHFLQTYNLNQTYQSQSRKLNVLVAITDVVSRNVLFLRKFLVPVFQTPAALLHPTTPALLEKKYRRTVAALAPSVIFR